MNRYTIKYRNIRTHRLDSITVLSDTLENAIKEFNRRMPTAGLVSVVQKMPPKPTKLTYR